MTTQEAIKWFEKFIDVYEMFPIKNDMKLEAYKLAVDALKKQIPKIPHIWEDKYYFSPMPNDDWGYSCPCCGNREIDYPELHCECGQTLDWKYINA